MKKNSIALLSILFSLLASVSILPGCGTVPVKKELMPQKDNITCDEKADEALRGRRYEKSIILHEFFLKENPDNGLAMYHMGYSYGQLGDHENEVKCYEKAISMGFYGSNIFFNLGMVYGEMGRFEDSVRIFKRAIELEPDRADSHFGLAFVYQKMDAPELAEQEFKEALKLDPDDIDSIYFLGVHYVETGRIDEARNELDKLMKIAPDNEMALSLKMLLENRD